MTRRWGRGKKVAEIVATVAPTVATALGGPLAGVAARAIGQTLLGRSDADLGDVEAAILAASPADLVKLKELELDFERHMAEAGVKLERIAANDRASARVRQAETGDWAPTILGVTIIVGFFGALGYLFKFGMPTEGEEVLLLMLGALGALTTQVANYFFGSSTGSKSKEAIIASLKERV